MTDGGQSPFDLEPEGATPAEPTPPPAPAPAPTPTRTRRRDRTAEEKPKRVRRRDVKADATAEAADAGGGIVWKIFTSPRHFYVLSAVMSAALTFALFNPSFGAQSPEWFWEVLKTGGMGQAYTWNPALLQAALLPLMTLAFLAAALTKAGPARGWWVAAWVFIAFVTFQIERDQLQYLVPLILSGAGVGLLIRRADGSRDTRGLVIMILALGSFLFMPVPPRGEHAHPHKYVAQAVGLVQALVDAPALDEAAAESDSGLTKRLKLLLYGLPQYVMLLVFILMLLAVMGLDGRWLGYTAASLLFTLIIATTILNWQRGSATLPPMGMPDWQDWWGGATEAALSWRARFTLFLPALAGCLVEIGRRRSA